MFSRMKRLHLFASYLYCEQFATLADDFWKDTEKVQGVDKISLTAPFKMEEIKEALFSSEGDKSPGPDGQFVSVSHSIKFTTRNTIRSINLSRKIFNMHIGSDTDGRLLFPPFPFSHSASSFLASSAALPTLSIQPLQLLFRLLQSNALRMLLLMPSFHLIICGLSSSSLYGTFCSLYIAFVDVFPFGSILAIVKVCPLLHLYRFHRCRFKFLPCNKTGYSVHQGIAA